MKHANLKQRFGHPPGPIIDRRGEIGSESPDHLSPKSEGPTEPTLPQQERI